MIVGFNGYGCNVQEVALGSQDFGLDVSSEASLLGLMQVLLVKGDLRTGKDKLLTIDKFVMMKFIWH